MIIKENEANKSKYELIDEARNCETMKELEELRKQVCNSSRLGDLSHGDLTDICVEIDYRTESLKELYESYIGTLQDVDRCDKELCLVRRNKDKFTDQERSFISYLIASKRHSYTKQIRLSELLDMIPINKEIKITFGGTIPFIFTVSYKDVVEFKKDPLYKAARRDKVLKFEITPDVIEIEVE